jgi:uncharacterized protein involved in type VI secretion and phage assembly
MSGSPSNGPEIWPTSGTCLGVTLAEVSNTHDEKGLGRIKVKFKLKGGQIESDWLQIMSPFACSDYGHFFLPETGASALLAFADGDPSKPYVLGFLWNGAQKPPISKTEQQDVRVIHTKAGKKIVFDDSKEGKIEITDEHGNVVRIGTSNNEITLESKGSLSIAAKKTIAISAQEVVISSNGGAVKAELNEGGMTLSAEKNIKLSAPMIDLN